MREREREEKERILAQFAPSLSYSSSLWSFSLLSPGSFQSEASKSVNDLLIACLLARVSSNKGRVPIDLLMANPQGTANLRYPQTIGKQSFLPPKSPTPAAPPVFGDYSSIHRTGPVRPKPREGQRPHQRTTSESFLEEQPSWLDDLLNEPENPVRRGAHKRSSSDSFAYLDSSNISWRTDNLVREGHGMMNSLPSWVSDDVDHLQNVQQPSHFVDATSFGGPQNTGWESTMKRVPSPSNTGRLAKEKNVHQGSSSAPREPDASSSNNTGKQVQEDSSREQVGFSERTEESQPKNTQSEMETKRAKQQFAQRSRVRKLQYIAELERNVQALQAEGLEFSAQMEFLDQQNLILIMENKALKQRFDGLAQEHLLKCLQQETLEREIVRLRALYYHQQQHQPPQMHRRNKSKDLDSQFAKLSLNQSKSNSGADSVRGPLQI